MIAGGRTYRSSRGVATIANPRNEAPPDHLVHVLRRGLHDDADAHDDCEDDEHAPAPELLTHKKRKHGTCETPEIVHGDNEALNARSGVVEVLLEFVCDDDAPEDALFVAKEQHCGARGERDGRVESLWRLEEAMCRPAVRLLC